MDTLRLTVKFVIIGANKHHGCFTHACRPLESQEVMLRRVFHEPTALSVRRLNINRKVSDFCSSKANDDRSRDE